MENSVAMSSPNSLSTDANAHEAATFGTGCFWCTEAVFELLEGVISVQSGYSNGHVEYPTYRQICSGATGHAECLKIIFDPKIISYEDLLTVFWHCHNPTTLNRQGNDAGTQYRSAIFYHTEKQKEIAEKSKSVTEASDLWADPIVTEITAAAVFYPAEDYHQEYFRLHGSEPYCSYIIAPKVQKIKKDFKDKLKK